MLASTHSRLLCAAVAGGREPAEALSPIDRRRVLASFLAGGWTLPEIADHTMTTGYTLARWMDLYGLRVTARQRWAS